MGEWSCGSGRGRLSRILLGIPKERDEDKRREISE